MQDSSKVKISEIFESIQGEGLEVGRKHVFLRFTCCNLNCAYCDTDFSAKKEYDVDELVKIIEKFDSDTLSLTGGEPLLEADFILKLAKKTNKKIYLETNGTLYEQLNKVIDCVDVISMDIKLKSATGQENRFLDNEKFLAIASKKKVFIKVVFDNSITDEEIFETIKLAKNYNTEIILQPKMPMSDDLRLEEIFNKFFLKYKNIRLIPQTHKFLHLA